ncbi:MAG: class I SAM-dependent methyltransferase [Candidatus Omnitrophota bacterium]
MDEKSKREMNTYYSGRLKEYGPTKEALVYRSDRQQTDRYALLADIEPMAKESSLLDVGCGLGFLCDYLRSYGWKGKYTGIDINPDMIKASQKRLPKDNFLCKDILTERFDEQYDYVFCAATVQLRPTNGDPVEYMQAMVKKMFSLTRGALAFDVFSGRVDYQDKDKLYVDPARLLDFCYTLTRRVVLRNDTRPYELMMYLYRKAEKDDANRFVHWMTRTPQIY